MRRGKDDSEGRSQTIPISFSFSSRTSLRTKLAIHTLIDTFMFNSLRVSSKVFLKNCVKYHFKGIASRDLYSKQYFLYER